ncbi:hypothetical protein AUJ77_02915 [Candidatus Nomurabacteria bacterium CG1_02_43_90]|uniref:Uncharacterized protein n=1 Tax=Candidatus Nomurabacteria bacterium CG1_02_43_90 TaxID=1805281 RepID=A0A1J4V034_9BACT|nr:MAG: hypothetical protein AUJ77_02915 [Candidatus Nomurabacteria bacterium CG1_02_43_90]
MVFMNMFNFEKQQNSNPQHPPFRYNEEMEKRVRLSVDEVRAQLMITGNRFEEALEKQQAGDNYDEEYLADYQENLIAWIADLDGALGRNHEEVLNEVKRRLFILSEVLEEGIN